MALDYSTFDTLGDKKSRNKIIAALKKEALTFDEIGDRTGLNRTTVFYHVKNLERESMAVKKFVGKTVYVGLKQERRY